MKTLKEPDEYITRYLGTQKEEYGVKYKLNPYLVEDGFAVYNSLTGEAVLLETGDTNEDLIRRWFLVPEDYDIKTLADLVHSNKHWLSFKQNSSSKYLYVVFTTTACNASCEYCFEKNYKRISMREDTALDVADYIIATRDKKSTIRIKWFGGEPLVNKKAINIICEKIQNAGVSFVSSMTTNGHLFTECSDEELKLWNLKSVQLTVDNTDEQYGIVKGLPSDAYEKLKKTADRLSNLGIKIQLRIHYNPLLGIDICKKIVDDFKHIPNLSMYSRILYGLADPETYKELMIVEDYIERAGKAKFGLPKKGSVFHCMADNPGIATITPDGALSPCEHYAYGEQMYGSIYAKETNRRKLDEWSIKEKRRNADCANCCVYPTCKKLVSCPAEESCSSGYRDYKIETIKRALRKKVSELNGSNS